MEVGIKNNARPKTDSLTDVEVVAILSKTKVPTVLDIVDKIY